MLKYAYARLRVIPFALAASILVATSSSSWAEVLPDAHIPDANSMITANMVNQSYSSLQGGNYYNTAGSSTTFQNGTALYLGSGTVHAFEVIAQGNGYIITGNGGFLSLIAPVIKLDGNIDVSGVMRAGQMGAGGTVQITGAYLYQNGVIYANGSHGGFVNINVGGMAGNGKIFVDATVPGGDGGRVDVNASVKTIPLSLFDSAGKLVGKLDSSVVDVKGQIVQFNGINIASNAVIVANGASASSRNGNGGDGGIIRLVSATGPVKNDGTLQVNGGAGKHAGSLGEIVVQGGKLAVDSNLAALNNKQDDFGGRSDKNSDKSSGKGTDDRGGKDDSKGDQKNDGRGDSGKGNDDRGGKDDSKGDQKNDGRGDNGKGNDDRGGKDDSKGDHNHDGRGDNGKGNDGRGNDGPGNGGDRGHDGRGHDGRGHNGRGDDGHEGPKCGNGDGENPPNEHPPTEEPPVISNGDPNSNNNGFDTNGLFQQNRYTPNVNMGSSPKGHIVLGMGQPNMFLFKAYSSVTGEILQNAFAVYKDAKIAGLSEYAALLEVGNYLKGSGMDPSIASALLEQINNGSLQVAEPVAKALQAMASISG